MKLYIPKIKITSRIVYWYPFAFISEIQRSMYVNATKRKLRRHFIKLAWDKSYVWKKTMFCGCLDDAVARLRYELLESFGLEKKWLYAEADSMITARFDDDWS